MRLQVLGCGDAFGSGGRFNTCFHVSAPPACFLVDCGATSLVAIRRFGVDPNWIEAVFLTHLHGDHFGGLPWLILDGQLVSGRVKPLTIAGPKGTQARLEAAMEALFPGSTGVERRFSIEVREWEPERPDTICGVSVTPFAVEHPSGAPAFALRIACCDSVLAYTGDTQWVDALIPACREADLMIAEALTLDRPVPFHLDWATLKGRLPEIAPKRLMLTHMGVEMIAHPPEGYIAAQDGMVIEI